MVSSSPPDLSEFSKNGVFLDSRRIYLSPAGNFRERTSHSHNFREFSGGRGRWGKPISHTRFFHFNFNFYLFSQHYEVLLPQTRNYSRVTQLLLIIAHMKIASNNHDHSTHPTPSLPHDSDHAECGGVLAYTDRLRFSLFCFGLSRPLVETFGSNFRRSPEENFVLTFRNPGGIPSAHPGRI